MHIVLVEPEIPQNTGNIARTCAATGIQLHLVEPMGFRIEDRYLRRAGLDYWPMVNLRIHASLEAFFAAFAGAEERMHFATTKAPRMHTEARYGPDDILVFGRETRGLPEALLERVWERCVRIPMRPDARSLNLSNSVAILAYEALRQQDFAGLLGQGALTGRSEEPQPWLDML